MGIGAGKHGEGGNDLGKMQCQLDNPRELLELEAPWKEALQWMTPWNGHGSVEDTQREDTRGNMQELEWSISARIVNVGVASRNLICGFCRRRDIKGKKLANPPSARNVLLRRKAASTERAGLSTEEFLRHQSLVCAV